MPAAVAAHSPRVPRRSKVLAKVFVKACAKMVGKVFIRVLVKAIVVAPARDV